MDPSGNDARRRRHFRSFVQGDRGIGKRTAKSERNSAPSGLKITDMRACRVATKLRLSAHQNLASGVFAADPTFLRRYIPDIQPQADDLTAGAKGALYRPAFGVGDSQSKQLKGIARYGELTIASDGTSAIVS